MAVTIRGNGLSNCCWMTVKLMAPKGERLQYPEIPCKKDKCPNIMWHRKGAWEWLRYKPLLERIEAANKPRYTTRRKRNG